MKIAIAGGSGFIGKAITKQLVEENNEVVILTRDTSNKSNSENITYVQWLNDYDEPEKFLKKIDVFINLAGESLNSGRWTSDRKKSLIQSRITATREINRILTKLEQPPLLLLNASAIGYYGTSLNKLFTEHSICQPSDFLSNIVHQWEKEALKATSLPIRTVLMRFGVVLDAKEGALPRMIFPYKCFIGGTIGKGDQWLSWIHIKDVVKAVLFCINTPTIHGPVNFTSPNPENMQVFGKKIANTLHRPHWLPVPSLALKLGLGEMSLLVLEGQKVIPELLLQSHFHYEFPNLEDALHDILQ